MKTVAVINQKGGTGKTTTAVNLAAACAARGYWVLLVDLDPQSSAAYSLGLDPAREPATLARAILDERPLVDMIRTTGIEGVEVVLGGPELATLELRIKNPLTAVRVLARLLEPVKPAYDLCIMDAPPALSLMFTNALSSADGLLVPVTPSFLSAKGLEALMATIDEARADLQVNPELLGIVLTMVDKRLALDKEVEANLRSVFGAKVLEQTIRLTVRLKEAPGHFRSIFTHAPGSSGAQDYDALADEVLARLKLPVRQEKETEVIEVSAAGG
ncbi:MAG: ParA family protein [Planctomycetota bacterium]|nr:ParA family protein [Planctomycetota bacterium]